MYLCACVHFFFGWKANAIVPLSNVLLLIYLFPGKSTLARRLVLEFSSRFPDLHMQIDLKGGFLSQSNYIDLADAMVTVSCCF